MIKYQASNIKIIFMGTPHFAVESLRALIKNNFNVVAVITAPDKPAGRGRKIQESAVKKYALQKNLNILQPKNLKDPEFISLLQKLKADLQLVVAFRMLPEIVLNMPKFGTINLHASLLPQYRGAAPINRAIINGEKETGITTFFIEKQIDTGNILFQEKIPINENENAGELHDKLMYAGADLVVKTVNAIKDGSYKTIKQKSLITHYIKPAPKINKQDCKINWDNSVHNIYNFIRGLSPYPTAWTQINSSEDKKYYLKIFKTIKIAEKHNLKSGEIISDNKNYFKIAGNDGFLDIRELQLEGKKRLSTEEFLKGFKF